MREKNAMSQNCSKEVQEVTRLKKTAKNIDSKSRNQQKGKQNAEKRKQYYNSLKNPTKNMHVT